MKKTNNSRSNSPQPQPTTGGEGAAAILNEKTAANVTELRPGKGQRLDHFETRLHEMSEAAANKVHQLSEAKQRLAEARDLYAEGDAKAEEAKEAAARGGILLFQARTAGTITGEELNATLGDQFGYKPKADGTPGKTPDGQGEAIRKRIVRAVQAYDHVNGGDGGKFFAGLPEEEVGDILNGMTNGQIGFWAAYERFAEVKRDYMTKLNPAFDPKRIIGLATALSEDGAAQAIAGNKALDDAYVALYGVIKIVSEEIETLRRKAA